MKKRLLSAILAFILILGAVPAVAAETTPADPTAEVAAAPRAPKELAPTSATVPKISGITPTATGLKIQWSAYAGAAKYYLYLKKDNKWKTLAVTTATAYEHKGLNSNTIYTYTVRAADKNGKLISGYDRNGSSKRFLSTPTLVRCESTTTGQKVIWKPVTGAVAYRVYIKSGKNWIVAGTTSGTYCINTRVTSGKAYAYTVRCWDKTAGAPLSYYNTKGIMGVYVATPQITSFNAINGGVTLKWSQCNGAKYYGVFRKYSTGWKRIATTAKTSYSDTTIRYSARYTYTVRCLDANRKYNSAYNKNGWSFTHLEPPQLTSVTYRDQKYTLTWGSQKTASKYGVYRKKLGEKWQVIGRPKTNTFTDTTADKDGIYTYAVRTLDAAGNFLTYYNDTGRYYRMGVCILGTPEAKNPGVTPKYTCEVTEEELRQQVVEIAKGWIGTQSGSAGHSDILNYYNTHSPLADSRKLVFANPWSAAFVSAVWIRAGIADFTGTHYDCGSFITVAQDNHIWVELDNYTPKVGDAVVYGWTDSGSGDFSGTADHMGIITEINGNDFTVVEGDTGTGYCGTNTRTVNQRYIRGYITPHYSRIAQYITLRAQNS